MRPFDDIDEFFEPGDTLEGELDEERLQADLEWQKDVLLQMRHVREERAYTLASDQADENGLSEPTDQMVEEWVRHLDPEKDLPPN